MVKFTATLVLFAIAAGILFSDSAAATSVCLRSETAVKHAFPHSWPSWTKRESGHKGERCWFPSGRHEANVKHAYDAVGAHPDEPRRVKTVTDKIPNDAARLKTVLSAIVRPAVHRDTFNDRFVDSFDARFAGADSARRPGVLQQMMDPTGVLPQ
jgi:hypothetical protein